MSRGQSSILQNLFQLHFAKEYLNSKSYVSGSVGWYYVDRSLTLRLESTISIPKSELKFLADNAKLGGR